MVSGGADICKVLTLWKVLIDVSFISRLRSDNDSWAAADNLVNREIVKDRMRITRTSDKNIPDSEYKQAYLVNMRHGIAPCQGS